MLEAVFVGELLLETVFVDEDVTLDVAELLAELLADAVIVCELVLETEFV